MKNYNLFVTLICIGLFGCSSILRSNKGKPINEVKFNVRYFSKHKINGHACDTLRDGTIITLLETQSGCYENEKKTNTPYSLRYTFYKDSYSIKGGGTFFYDNPIGVFKEYDKQGNIISTKDYNSFYKFSIQNLIDKMAADYKINLMNPIDRLYIQRYVDNKKGMPIYSIHIPFSSYAQSFRYILLNGNTGQVFLDTTGYYEE